MEAAVDQYRDASLHRPHNLRQHFQRGKSIAQVPATVVGGYKPKFPATVTGPTDRPAAIVKNATVKALQVRASVLD